MLRGDAGFGHNLLTNVVTPSTPAGLGASRTALRRDPVSILVTASRRADTLRSLGEDTVEGEKNDVITFADADGTQISLYVSAGTGLLSKYETLADNPVLGDTVTETALSDYRPVSGRPGAVPRRDPRRRPRRRRTSSIRTCASTRNPRRVCSSRPPRRRR